MPQRLVTWFGVVYPIFWVLRHIKATQAWASSTEDWVMLGVLMSFTLSEIVKASQSREPDLDPTRPTQQYSQEGETNDPQSDEPAETWEEKQERQVYEQKLKSQRGRRVIRKRMKKESQYPDLVQRILSKGEEDI